MLQLTPENIRAACADHETIFFDGDLNPVLPKPGQWFCEFDLVLTEEGNEIVRDEALVEYQGLEDQTTFNSFLERWTTSKVDVVWDEQSDRVRQPNGWILIRQN
jgi:hypothetical protein